MSIFEQATRLKLRFESPKGLLTTEDLWDLNLTSAAGKANLDDIARGLHMRLKDEGNISFVNTPATLDHSTTQLAFDVVKHIIDVRLAENKAAAQAREIRERDQKIMAIISRKKDAALEALDVAELEKLMGNPS